MATTNHEPEIVELRSELAALRDEIRLRLHLGAMDARDTFHNVEQEIEHVTHGTSRATKQALIKARARLRDLADSLRDGESQKST